MAKFAAVLAAAAVAQGAALNMVPIVQTGNYVPNQYLIQFNPAVPLEMVNAMAAETKAFRVLNIGSFKAITGYFSPETIAKLQSRSDLVEVIENDQVVYAYNQSNPTWGLDRVDQRSLPLDNMYRYDSKAGAGVDAYIVDTGINLNHEDFAGRIFNGYNFHDNTPNADDDNGHGTHCAGTVAGSQYGVAKKANLIAVKTLGRFGSGNLANVAAGVNYAVSQHQSKNNARSVVSMSLGGGASTIIDNAVKAAWKAGLVVVVASGNSNTDACASSPARVSEVITVNAANINDRRASFSNYGPCTEIFAPGQDITSAWIGSAKAINTISGTSMACPHVAGAAALILANGNSSPDAVKNQLLTCATKNAVADHKGDASNNLLLNTLCN